MNQQQALFKYTLRWADNALILSQRLSEWCGKAPMIEEDLALTNFALDLLGRAQALLQYAAELEGKGRTADDLAYKRSEREYFNNLLTELPNGDFGSTMVRQLFISLFEQELFTALQHSKDPMLAAIAQKTLKEVNYHLEHAADWVIRLGNGTAESRTRISNAVDELWMFTGELFDMDETDELLAKDGISADLALIEPAWNERVLAVLEQAGIGLPFDSYMQTGSRTGIHTEHLGHLLCEMQFLQRAYPGATW